MDRFLGRLIRTLLPPHWGEAVLSEAEQFEPGWARTRWLAGGVITGLKEGLMLVRWGAWGGIAAAAFLVAYTVWRYPAAAGGGGGPMYLSLVAMLLLGYAATSWWVTRGAVGTAGVRRGTQFGAVAAAVAGLAAMPYGLTIARAAVLPLTILAVLILLSVAAIKAMRDTGSPMQALIAGFWAGALTALGAFLWGMAMAVTAPQRLAIDSDVAAHHSGADLIAANLGEQSVTYILGLVAGPLLGVFAAAAGIIIASAKDPHRRNEAPAGPHDA